MLEEVLKIQNTPTPSPVQLVESARIALEIQQVKELATQKHRRLRLPTFSFISTNPHIAPSDYFSLPDYLTNCVPCCDLNVSEHQSLKFCTY